MTDFEKRLTGEREQADKLMVRMDGIITALGFEPQTDDERAKSTIAHSAGTRGDGAGCAMRADTYGLKGRMSFVAWTPRTEDGGHVETPKKVTFGIDRTDEQIKEGIKSRYLAKFEHRMEEYRVKNAGAKAAIAKREELITLTGALLGLPVLPAGIGCHQYPRIYEYLSDSPVSQISVDTCYSGEQVTVELHLTREALIAVCEALAPYTKGGKWQTY